MPYAITEWPRLQAAALASGFEVQVRREASVTTAEWLTALAAAGHNQPDLLAAAPCRSGAAHFPVSTVWIGDRFSAPLLGVMPTSAWQRTLARMLANIDRDQAQVEKPNATPPAARAAPIEAPRTPAQLPPSRCIPALEYIPLSGADALAELGSYERVSPDGRFVLRSFSGGRLTRVSLMELSPTADSPRSPDRQSPSQRSIRLHPTGLSNEAFPVQGSWRYLVDTDGRHFRFTDVLSQGSAATPLFRAGMTGFYAAASELPPNGDASIAYIRSLSWPLEGDAASGSAGTGPLQVRTVAIELSKHRVVADTGPQFICTEPNASEGGIFTLPMIGVDATRFSALPVAPTTGKPTMRVYALSPQPMARTHTCERILDLGQSPSKAVFGYGPNPRLAYTDNATVWFYDPASAKSYPVDDAHSTVLASAFPAITRDGRIVFGATWKDCTPIGCTQKAGYVVADPNQQSHYVAHARAQPGRAAPQCIRREQVQAEERAFARFHGLTLPH